MESSLRCLLAGLILFLSGCVTTPPAGSPETGYTLQGFVGQNSMTPAPMLQVVLLDGTATQPLATAQTNFFGKYAFPGLPPGQYVLQVEEVKRPVAIVGEGVRLDIDLSAKGGAMNYAAGAAAAAATPAAGGGAPAGPNDPRLQQEIAGVWWGYAGSTERQIGLCPGGVYRDFRESSYSGTSSDSLGNQTMAWGSASQGGGAGSWTISGDTQSGTVHVRYASGDTAAIPFRQISDPGCLDFDGATLCRKSKSCE